MHRHRLCKVLLGDMVNDRNKLKCYSEGENGGVDGDNLFFFKCVVQKKKLLHHKKHLISIAILLFVFMFLLHFLKWPLMVSQNSVIFITSNAYIMSKQGDLNINPVMFGVFSFFFLLHFMLSFVVH